MSLTDFEKNLAEQEVLGLATGWYNAHKITIGDDGIVRFDNFQNERPGTFATNQYIDLNEQNAVTDAIETIRQNVLQDIQDSSTLQALLEKDQWSYDDRTVWESYVSKFVSQRHNEIEGLDTYRIESSSPVQRITDLKDLGGDLNSSGTPQFEHDCETMRSVEGIVATLVEKELLPDESSGQDDYKQNGAYISVNGGVKYSIAQEAGGHAFLISSLTGNIIEGTSDPDYGQLPYNDTGVNYSYADFVAGELATTQKVSFDTNDPSIMNFKISVYGSYYGHGDPHVVEQRRRLIETEQYEALNQTTFDSDTKLENEEYFKSAFYRDGEITFTVQKPVEDTTEGDQSFDEGFDQELQNFLDNEKELPTGRFGDAFFDQMQQILEDNDFAERGKPTVLTTDDGTSYLIYRDQQEGRVKIYDSTGRDFEGVTELRFSVEEKALPPAPIPTPDPLIGPPIPDPDPAPLPQPSPPPEPVPQPDPIPQPVVPGPAPSPPPPPEPAPDPSPTEPKVEICTQLHNVTISEFVDGKGILNDTGNYNDADAMKGMVEAAKGLGLSPETYRHIEEAMDEGKFLSTEASIRSIEASYAAMKEAEATGLNALDTERAVVQTFFDSITADDLITDTEDMDDKSSYIQEDLEHAQTLASEIDNKFHEGKECGVVHPSMIKSEIILGERWARAADPTTPDTLRGGSDPTHVVAKGETYSSISQKYYGSASPEVYNALAEYNGHDADHINPGDKINIPSSLDDIDATRITLPNMSVPSNAGTLNDALTR